MTIKVRCGSCKTTIKAKESLAGQKVKCPKCAKPLTIPKPGASASPKKVAASASGASNAYNPMLDLLDEAGVDSMPTGPTCPNCAGELQPNAILCVECGFNLSTGENLETDVFEDEDLNPDALGMTDADKIMARAEKDIEDMPVTAVGQDFGDGADSFMIAGVAFVFLGLMVAGGIAVILLMDQLTEIVSTPFISLVASSTIYLMCGLWISFVAFKVNRPQAIACLGSLGLYCPIFGIFQGKGLMLPAILMIASLGIGAISYFFAFVYVGETDFGMLLNSGLAYLC